MCHIVKCAPYASSTINQLVSRIYFFGKHCKIGSKSLHSPTSLSSSYDTTSFLYFMNPMNRSYKKGSMSFSIIFFSLNKKDSPYNKLNCLIFFLISITRILLVGSLGNFTFFQDSYVFVLVLLEIALIHLSQNIWQDAIRNIQSHFFHLSIHHH